MMTGRRYPIGIQTFSEIIQGGYLYVDKTDLVWQLAHYAKYIFMSRPRRFGKSLLTSTLESYFQGQRTMFEGLKIMEFEQEWVKYPVIHVDLSGAKHMPASGVRDELNRIMMQIEEEYGANPAETTPGMRFAGVIERAYKQTGRQVTVLIDEYDAPLLDVLHEGERLKDMREVMQEFYQRLKMLEPKIRFCFITGITKFSQLSIFSTINNLTNVTLDPRFSTICGITEQELTTTMTEDINQLAQHYKMKPDMMHQKLKLQYDGYHFSEDSEEVYNPFSLLKAFQQRKVGCWWFESGTPTFLIRQMQHFKTDITSLESLDVPSTAFDQPTENMQDALPLLYQSGYLTIKDYDIDTESYTLSIPNQEVRIGFVKGLLPLYVGLNDANVQMGFAAKFWKALRLDDVDLAMQEMKEFMSGIRPTPDPSLLWRGIECRTNEAIYSPPSQGGAGGESVLLYLIFSMLNVYVKTQVHCAGGRADMVVWMPDTTYVFEMKVNGTAQEALKQIDSKDYALPYRSDGKRVVKVGVSFDAETRTPKDWLTARLDG